MRRRRSLIETDRFSSIAGIKKKSLSYAPPIAEYYSNSCDHGVEHECVQASPSVDALAIHQLGLYEHLKQLDCSASAPRCPANSPLKCVKQLYIGDATLTQGRNSTRQARLGDHIHAAGRKDSGSRELTGVGHVRHVEPAPSRQRCVVTDQSGRLV